MYVGDNLPLRRDSAMLTLDSPCAHLALTLAI